MHPVPVSERISIVYLDKGVLERDGHSVVLRQGGLLMPIPVGVVSVLMLGPGVSLTHAAVTLVAREGALLLFVGECGVRLYAAGNPRSGAAALVRQSQLFSNHMSRLSVARRIYAQMFGEEPPPRMSIEQIRGLEGSRVKRLYQLLADKAGLAWDGRAMDFESPINIAISGANAALYGLCEAVILALGYSPAIGFVHSGDPRSFVFDLADTVKFETVVPMAFDLVASGVEVNESAVRLACRDMFYRERLAGGLVSIVEELLSGDGGH